MSLSLTAISTRFKPALIEKQIMFAAILLFTLFFAFSLIDFTPFLPTSPDRNALVGFLFYHYGEKELMLVELICRYYKHGQVIIPPMSSDVQFSARPFCNRRPSRKLDGLRKALADKYWFMFEAEGVDCGLYVEVWKGTRILTEVLSVNLNKADYS